MKQSPLVAVPPSPGHTHARLGTVSLGQEELVAEALFRVRRRCLRRGLGRRGFACRQEAQVTGSFSVGKEGPAAGRGGVSGGGPGLHCQDPS